MQNTTETTTITTTTTETTATTTIAQLIERRRVERAEDQQQQEQQRAEERAAAEEEARESFFSLAVHRLSEDLWLALDLTITYDYNNGYRSREADRCAAVFTYAGAEWRLTTYQRDSWEHSYDREWTLRGPAPTDYKINLATWTGGERPLFDAQILDALEAYPDWLERQIARQSQKEAAERKQQQQPPQTPRYTRIYGTSLRHDDGAAILVPGRVVTLRVRQARGTLWDIAGKLLDVSNRWLLLDVPGKGPRLIPTNRIGEIVPGLPVVIVEVEEDEDAEKPQTIETEIETAPERTAQDVNALACVACGHEFDPDEQVFEAERQGYHAGCYLCGGCWIPF